MVKKHVSLISNTKKLHCPKRQKTFADLGSRVVLVICGPQHTKRTRGDRLDEGGDMARECLGMHEIVGTIPFYYIINWRNVGFLCGAVEREVREPLRQTHLAIYPYSCAFINQCGWSKKQSKPPKRKKHDSCGLRETSPFLPPCKYAYSILLIHPSSFLYSLSYPP